MVKSSVIFLIKTRVKKNFIKIVKSQRIFNKRREKILNNIEPQPYQIFLRLKNVKVFVSQLDKHQGIYRTSDLHVYNKRNSNKMTPEKSYVMQSNINLFLVKEAKFYG